MRAATRRKLAMAARVLEFFRTHPSDQPSYREVLQKLEAGLARAETLVSLRSEGALQLDAAAIHKEELSRRIRRELVPRLGRAGRAVVAERPDLAELFWSIRGATDRGFLMVATRILALAPAAESGFAENGVERTLIEDLTRAAEDLQRASGLIEEGRKAAQREGDELAQVVLEMSRLIGQLDGLNRHRFRGDGALQEAWTAARNAAVPFRPRPALRGSEGGVAPAA